jgi:amino acid adenylation domain-containing protein
MIRTLPEIIDNAALKSPSNEAFKCGKVSFTFGQINQKMLQLAGYLQSLDVQKGDRVGIYMERCIESVIAVYGIMKAGAVFVPLDPTAPNSRTITLLNDCGVEHIITTNLQSKKIIKILGRKQMLKSIIGITKKDSIPSVSWDFIYNFSMSEFTPVKIDEQDVAYIMYTSGSTGNPKGIMHTHYSGLNYAKLSSKLYQVSEEDRVANISSLHFDISTFGYFSSPLARACTVIIQEAYTKLPLSLSKLIEDEKISIWYSVPLALIQLLQKGALEDRKMDALRWVLFGGEVFTAKYLYQLMKKWPQATFCNVYGPAEINQCSYFHLDSKSEVQDTIPIGYIWDDTECKILGHNDAEVDQGNPGELVVHSTTMMKGYWNNEELTKNSFYKEDDKTYYRTGDVFKREEEGKLLFLGRNDYQVKVRGYRIEIIEIEAVITKHEDVQEVAVLVLESGNDVKELIATVILKVNTVITEKILIAHCKTFLPSYAVPAKIYIMKKFPRISSVKIDRGAIKKILIKKNNERKINKLHK